MRDIGVLKMGKLVVEKEDFGVFFRYWFWKSQSWRIEIGA